MSAPATWPPPAPWSGVVLVGKGVVDDVRAQLEHVQHEGTRQEQRLTRRQAENFYAVMGAWWTMDGCSMLTHDTAARFALELARR